MQYFGKQATYVKAIVAVTQKEDAQAKESKAKKGGASTRQYPPNLKKSFFLAEGKMFVM